MSAQPDLAAAVAAREEAIGRAEAHANEEWKRWAYVAVLWCADQLSDFTADDVWGALRQLAPGTRTHAPSALGPVFRRAAHAGLIVQTGEQRATAFEHRHRYLTVWRAR